MHVVFIHGPAASGKHTIGSKLAELTGLPLFHNHLAVDAAKALFPFGSRGFNEMRATVWRAAFREAATAGTPFIFTFHPESSVEPKLIDQLVDSVRQAGGQVHFVELVCATQTSLKRLKEPSRSKFGKLTDSGLYRELDMKGAFAFPALPSPLVRIDTDEKSPDAAAREIWQALTQAG